MSFLEFRVQNFVRKRYLKWTIQYHKNEYQKCLERDLKCYPDEFLCLVSKIGLAKILMVKHRRALMNEGIVCGIRSEK